MTKGSPGWPDPRAAEQAKALLPQAREGGLRFEAYLPPALAAWVLERIAQSTFESPSEAVFVLLTEAQELEPHADLRQEFLRRRVQAGMDDSGVTYSAEEVRAHLEALARAPRPQPALWSRPDEDEADPAL